MSSGDTCKGVKRGWRRGSKARVKFCLSLTRWAAAQGRSCTKSLPCLKAGSWALLYHTSPLLAPGGSRVVRHNSEAFQDLAQGKTCEEVALRGFKTVPSAASKMHPWGPRPHQQHLLQATLETCHISLGSAALRFSGSDGEWGWGRWEIGLG